MGVDLTLLPFESTQLGGWPMSHTVLWMNRDSETFQQISALETREGRPVPEDFTSYVGRDNEGETAYGRTIKTPYGSPLRYVLAGSLKQIDMGDMSNPGAWKQRAIWAFVRELPDDLPVALYWH